MENITIPLSSGFFVFVEFFLFFLILLILFIVLKLNVRWIKSTSVCSKWVKSVLAYQILRVTKHIEIKNTSACNDVNPTNDYHLRWTIPQQSVKVDNGTQMPTMMLVNLLESCKKSNCSDHYIKLITSWPKVNPWITTSMSKKRRTCPTLNSDLGL